jgi:hypothetical protein
LDTLSASESFLEVVFAAAALVVAAWSVRMSVVSRRESAATGELVWTFVAAGILLAVVAAVGFGAGHGV